MDGQKDRKKDEWMGRLKEGQKEGGREGGRKEFPNHREIAQESSRLADHRALPNTSPAGGSVMPLCTLPVPTQQDFHKRGTHRVFRVNVSSQHPAFSWSPTCAMTSMLSVFSTSASTSGMLV